MSSFVARAISLRHRTPSSSTISTHRFSANGHDFKVPLAQDFQIGDLTVDELIGNESTIAEHSKVAEACEILEALLPRDGGWHPAKPIEEACSENGVDQRTAQRAKVRLRIEHRRTQSFPAAVEWRWPATDDALTSSNITVASVVSVATENTPNPLQSSSDDTHDRHDSENERRQCGRDWQLDPQEPEPAPPAVASGDDPIGNSRPGPGTLIGYQPRCTCVDGGDEPTDDGRCSRCHGDLGDQT